MKERNRDQAWRMIVGFDRRRPTSDDIWMPTRRGNVGRRTSEASGFPARPGGVMPRHDTSSPPKQRHNRSLNTKAGTIPPTTHRPPVPMFHPLINHSFTHNRNPSSHPTGTQRRPPSPPTKNDSPRLYTARIRGAHYPSHHNPFPRYRHRSSTHSPYP